ncbi:hypothetical protein B0H14DRAFT_3430260 [Mycena olivaceomarginata]|nr:hypothetical protein B0H14DRAFT_3430260 [Mycena olivaceomarginata]
MGAIEAGSAAPALKATAVLRNFRGFRRRAPRMGTAWGCAHGCEAAASLPASGGTSCAFPTERGPTPLRRERARTFRAESLCAVPAAHPFRRAGRCAGSTSLPAPACRPTPALEQGGGACGNGTGRRRRRAGPALHRSLMVPNSPIRAGGGAGRGREGGIPVAVVPPARARADLVVGSGRTRAPRQPSSLRPPPARPPLRANPRFRKCAREDLACGWLEVYQRGGRGGGYRGIEVTQQGGRGGAERGRAGSTRLAARAPDFENAGGNGGRDAAGMPPISPATRRNPFMATPETSRSTLGVYPGHFAKFLYAQVVLEARAHARRGPRATMKAAQSMGGSFIEQMQLWTFSSAQEFVGSRSSRAGMPTTLGLDMTAPHFMRKFEQWSCNLDEGRFALLKDVSRMMTEHLRSATKNPKAKMDYVAPGHLKRRHLRLVRDGLMDGTIDFVPMTPAQVKELAAEQKAKRGPRKGKAAAKSTGAGGKKSRAVGSEEDSSSEEETTTTTIAATRSRPCGPHP